jgi:hypothetical protein
VRSTTILGAAKIPACRKQQYLLKTGRRVASVSRTQGTGYPAPLLGRGAWRHDAAPAAHRVRVGDSLAPRQHRALRALVVHVAAP